jgi:tRNA threonylcarbamoyladenosine biosynthesis protein TsaE
MQTTQKYISQSAEETKFIGRGLGKRIKGATVIALMGEVGAGKTTFTQGLVEGLGSTARVKSPTYTVMNEYPIKPARGWISRVLHIDFYRFTKESDLSALSLEDERRPDTVIIAEWPDILDDDHWLLKPDIIVAFDHLKNPDERLILMKGSFTKTVAT